MEKFLVVVDMQRDFIDGDLGTPEAQAIVPRVVERIRAAQAEGRRLLFTQDTHTPDYLATNEGRHLPIPHCIEGTEGWQLDASIAAYAKKAITKPSFGSPALVTELQRYAKNHGANLDIEFCGLCTDICVVTNALLVRSHLPEASLSVNEACCAGVTPQRHQAALSILSACHVDIRTPS